MTFPMSSTLILNIVLLITWDVQIKTVADFKVWTLSLKSLISHSSRRQITVKQYEIVTSLYFHTQHVLNIC
jgi:hypothetical protein